MRQPEEQISRWRIDGDEIIHSVVGNAAAGRPIGRRQTGMPVHRVWLRAAIGC